VVRYDLGSRVILQMAPDGLPAGVELWREDGLEPAPHPTQHIAFAVSDVPALLGHVRSLGYRVLTEPYRIGAETVAFVADLDGHIIELNDFRGRGVAEAARPDPGQWSGTPA
jgi:catechol 2,3-dioxygenase-like lactoylglutathione lyase family enzyme